jgi:protein TonB
VKGNLLISCIIALAVHTLLFVLPLHGVGSRSACPVKPPISVSIIYTKAPARVAPVDQVPAEIPEKSYPSPKKKTAEKESPHAEKEAPRKQTTVNIPAAEPVVSEAETALHTIPSSANEAAIGALPDHGERLIDSQHQVAAVGNQRGEDVIEYAQPRYKENPLPDYPKVARRRGYEGRTLLRVQVLRTGEVGQIEVETSSGFELLDEAALRSVKEWNFVPGTKNGVRIDQWVMIPVTFSLK